MNDREKQYYLENDGLFYTTQRKPIRVSNPKRFSIEPYLTRIKLRTKDEFTKWMPYHLLAIVYSTSNIRGYFNDRRDKWRWSAGWMMWSQEQVGGTDSVQAHMKIAWTKVGERGAVCITDRKSAAFQKCNNWQMTDKLDKKTEGFERMRCN